MKELVIASLNTHKVYEIREALKQLLPYVQVLSLFDFPQYQKPEIKEATFEKNAEAKALHAAATLQKICISDDSGILVPALEKVGAPLHRRYENEVDSPTKQTKKLLEEMRHFKELERQAYLQCSLAIAAPEKLIQIVTQRCEGYIVEEERGKMTFEFDTIFIKHDYMKTLGELTGSVRSRISHRRKALEKLLPSIERALR